MLNLLYAFLKSNRMCT